MTIVLPDASQLVARCLAGDDVARAEFINTYDTLLGRAIARRLNQYRPRGAYAAEAEDIRHEIYIKLFENRCRALEALKTARSMEAWLVTVARNHTTSYMRKRLSRELTDSEAVAETPPNYGATPEQTASERETGERVRAALDRLDPKDRLVLQLYYLHDQKYADIAGTLGMNINTVASRLMRAKDKLREILGEESR